MNRRGKSLAEMIVVISLLGGILGTAGTVIYRLMQAERALESDLVWQRSLLELTEQFRADAHAALSATVDENGMTVTLKSSQGTVLYGTANQGIRRVALAADGATAEQEYRGPTNGVHFAVTTEDARSWAVLQIPRTGTPLTKSSNTGATPHRLEIRAAIHRFPSPPGKEGDT